MQWCNSMLCLEKHNYQLLCLVMHHFLIYQDIMLQNETTYKRYRHAGSTEKVISLLGKKNTSKKTQKEDSELATQTSPQHSLSIYPNLNKKT